MVTGFSYSLSVSEYKFRLTCGLFLYVSVQGVIMYPQLIIPKVLNYLLYQYVDWVCIGISCSCCCCIIAKLAVRSSNSQRCLETFMTFVQTPNTTSNSVHFTALEFPWLFVHVGNGSHTVLLNW